FTYGGPARPLVAVLWLLVHHPITWLVPALIWMVAWPFTLTGGTVALVASVAQYTALIAAGWIGWQRPWLFGVAAVLAAWGGAANGGSGERRPLTPLRQRMGRALGAP